MITAAMLIFLGSYAAIISEKIHRTIIAIFGGALMIIAGELMGFYDQHGAVGAIDFNTVGLLVGMMIIVGITKDTGVFQYVAVKAAKLAKGDPWKILFMFAIITAVFSALLDNVTTVLLMVPMTFVICDNLKINPMPFLMTEILMSNVGGTATLIGDPPNILIGSAAGLTFMQFVQNLAPIVIVMIIVLVPVFKFLYGKKIQTDKESMERIMHLNESDSLENIPLLKKSLFVLALVISGFFFHGALGMEAATIALFGAGLLLFLDGKNPERVLHEVEWITIFFFIGLFVLVGGLEHVGAINWAAERMLELTGGDFKFTSILILWGAAIFSAFVDNIPFVATMIPLVEQMDGVFAQGLEPIWWSLALGACLGGNGTLVGASANLVVAGMAEKAGYKIKFIEFMKVGLFIMFITVAMAQVYLWIKFY
ncbi:ArsB/NhaD family transporter [bacterium]|nr:ArsB/NhaD family transporter [bacterium]MBT4251486.1 ArsB/NhaD family transporter [bacterium]MBT4597460.1 ArsB/NhaD family transporter [bacterium]MBT6754299.1 ArsB/NhaD family transporter [bacterium]MBT7037625.1 ArsB/NhaD family transporter [bacterium]